MSHGLTHEDADSVVAAARGWYFERLLDGRVRISKYRIPEPNAGEQPEASITLEPQEWHEVVSALGFGESPVVGEIKPQEPTLPPPDQLPPVVPSEVPSAAPAGAPS